MSNVMKRPSHRSLAGWLTPFESFGKEFDELWSLLEGRSESGGRSKAGEVLMTPRCDIRETNEAYHIDMDLPGIEIKDTRISLRDGELTIAATRHKESHEGSNGFERVERIFGEFARRFVMPQDVDEAGVKATMKDGVLRIQLRKKEQTKAREIAVEVEPS